MAFNVTTNSNALTYTASPITFDMANWWPEALSIFNQTVGPDPRYHKQLMESLIAQHQQQQQQSAEALMARSAPLQEHFVSPAGPARSEAEKWLRRRVAEITECGAKALAV